MRSVNNSINTKIFLTFILSFGFLSTAAAQWVIDIDPSNNPVIAGTNIEYHIQVLNASGSNRNNAKVETTLPDHVTFVAASVACDTTALPAISCPLGNMSPFSTREFNLILRIDDDYVVPAGAGFFNLELEASADTGSASSNNELVSVTELADLKIAAFASDSSPRAGETVNLSITVDNFGPSTSRNVRLQAAVGAGGTSSIDEIIQVQSCAFSVSQGCGAITTFICTTGTFTLGQFLNDIGNFATDFLRPMNQNSASCPPGNSTGRIRGSFRFVAQDDMELSAWVKTLSDTPDPNMDNNQVEQMFYVSAVSDLEVTKEATGEVLVGGAQGLPYDLTSGAPFPEGPDFTTSPIAVTQGRRIRYAITVENNGPSEAENVTVIDRLPPGMVIVPGSLLVVDQAAAPTSGSCSFGTPGDVNDKMTCGLGTLSATTQTPVNQHFPTSKTIYFDVKVDLELAENTLLANDVTASSDSLEDNNSDNLATAFTVVSPLVGVSGCSVGGPYTNVICGSGSASFGLNGFGFALPQGGPLTYNWNTDCPDGLFSDNTIANPDFSMTTANPDNSPVSCQVELNVSNIYANSTCNGAVTVVDCLVDCNGVLDGAAELDRCGVCEGDGQSCLGCTEFNVSSNLEDISLANTQLLRLNLRVSRQMIRFGELKDQNKARRLRRKARKLHQGVVDSKSTIPADIKSCTNASFCVSTSNVTVMSEISSGSDSMLDLLKKGVKFLRSTDANQKALKRILRDGKQQFNDTQKLLGGIPTSSSECS